MMIRKTRVIGFSVHMTLWFYVINCGFSLCIMSLTKFLDSSFIVIINSKKKKEFLRVWSNKIENTNQCRYSLKLGLLGLGASGSTIIFIKKQLQKNLKQQCNQNINKEKLKESKYYLQILIASQKIEPRESEKSNSQ